MTDMPEESRSDGFAQLERDEQEEWNPWDEANTQLAEVEDNEHPFD